MIKTFLLVFCIILLVSGCTQHKIIEKSQNSQIFSEDKIKINNSEEAALPIEESKYIKPAADLTLDALKSHDESKLESCKKGTLPNTVCRKTDSGDKDRLYTFSFSMIKENDGSCKINKEKKVCKAGCNAQKVQCNPESASTDEIKHEKNIALPIKEGIYTKKVDVTNQEELILGIDSVVEEKLQRK